MRPTIRQLEYVVAIAEERSFSAAARRCFVTQPALSNQVRLLETQLAATLFERSAQGVLLTGLGRDVVELARQVLAASDHIVERASARRAPLSGRLSLGSVSTITPYLVPRLMAELPCRFPELELQVRDGTADVLEAQLAAGELDALIVPLPTGLSGCDELDLAFDPFVIAAPADSEIGRLDEPLSRQALAGLQLLLLEDPHCLRGQILEACSPLGAVAHGAIHSTSLQAIVQLIRRGLGATLLPALALPVELAGVAEVHVKRFADPPPGRRVGLVWRRGSPHADGFRALGAELAAHCQAVLA